MAGNFNIKDQLDFKFNVNGKEVSGEEAKKHAQELLNKMSEEMGGIIKKLGKNVTNKVTSKVASNGINAVKDKVLPNNLNLDSFKNLFDQEKLNELREKLPVIDASNDNGDIKVNVNGKPLFSLDLSNFKKN
ncbi:hypothetical protein [Niallia sp. 01092]|uniref:hypothetical protein n=1 Tax=unclassified Niallia TaxID=2837522 RepID=UPI003FD11E8E